MPFTLIKGSFLPSFGDPDGESVRFVPDDPGPLFRLTRQGRGPKVNRENGSIQLRYEAIDTLEKAAVQPFANDALEANLALIGSGPDRRSAPGHILANRLDPNGRPIAFVFAGDASEPDGSSVWLDVTGRRGVGGRRDTGGLTESVNFEMLADGQAYPMFYDTLYLDLRDALVEVSKAAKAAAAGHARETYLFKHDATMSGARWTGDASTLAPIFPKLWRRIEKAVRDPDYFTVAEPLRRVPDYIDREKDDRVLVMPLNDVTGFENVVEATADTIRLRYEPHELVFQP
ncbi:hypothetical protein [Salinarimonas rosea]|uniref:hypothetical protein n=1 Tax=Salinarimonas rosea TaxID=552063 RepID=UPI00042446C1|nr:hypothetical protein [Salinarimonas rosea]